MRLVTFCGSAGSGSANRSVLDMISDRAKSHELEVQDATDLADIPMLRPDQVDDPGAAVTALRSDFESADGIALAVPEYGGGAAGWAKNALDWMVGSGSLYGRPALVASAGSAGGFNAIEQIVRTLSWQGAVAVATVGISVPLATRHVDGRFTDSRSVAAIDLGFEQLLAGMSDEHARSNLHLAVLQPFGIDPHDRRG